MTMCREGWEGQEKIFGAKGGVVNESRVQGVGQIICRDTKDVENDGHNIGGERERERQCGHQGAEVINW